MLKAGYQHVRSPLNPQYATPVLIWPSLILPYWRTSKFQAKAVYAIPPIQWKKELDLIKILSYKNKRYVSADNIPLFTLSANRWSCWEANFARKPRKFCLSESTVDHGDASKLLSPGATRSWNFTRKKLPVRKLSVQKSGHSEAARKYCICYLQSSSEWSSFLKISPISRAGRALVRWQFARYIPRARPRNCCWWCTGFFCWLFLLTLSPSLVRIAPL